ncbi:hypothetical protein AGLY_013214 [Aphis glycines]|uniref:Uncharacterized protein n=1 Tax=Aphis glycines TaxID=307491 RepID=A0A6G0T6A9_APHGL|nr:hypothetical protein AGLY_013214 [Aphis glycines]
MSPCAVGYESILLADQKYEDRGGPTLPSPPNPTRPARNRLRPRPEDRQKSRSDAAAATDVSALCRHFLAAYNIRPDFFCKFQGRTNLIQCQQSGTIETHRSTYKSYLNLKSEYPSNGTIWKKNLFFLISQKWALKREPQRDLNRGTTDVFNVTDMTFIKYNDNTQKNVKSPKNLKQHNKFLRIMILNINRDKKSYTVVSLSIYYALRSNLILYIYLVPIKQPDISEPISYNNCKTSTRYFNNVPQHMHNAHTHIQCTSIGYYNTTS